MATSYPTALDTDTQFPKTGIVANVTSGEVQHTMNVYGAVQAVEAKVGIGASTPPSGNGRYLASKSDASTAWEPFRVYRLVLTSTTYTFAASDGGYALEYDSTSAGTWTVPTGLPDGTVIEVAQINTGVLTLAAGSGMTLSTPSTLVLRVQWSTAQIRVRTSTTGIVSGDLA